MARRRATIFINGKEVANEIKAISAEKRKLLNTTKRLTRGSEEYEAAIKEYRKLDAIVRQHRNELRGVESAWDKMKGGVGRFVGFAAAAFTADAIVGYGKELFKLGSEMEVLGKKAETVFGQALPLVTQQAKENATAMGLTVGAYVDAATAIGDLLIPMGFQREEAANISTELVNLSGALSEWTGGQFTAAEVSTKLSKAMLGEREELKALGISISEADVKQRLLEKGLDKLTGTMLQQAKATATLELITEKSTDAQAAFADGAGTMVRRQAEMSAKISEVSEKLATILMPVFERILSVMEAGADVILKLTGNLEDFAGVNNRASQSVAGLQAEFNLEVETLKRGNISTENRKKLIDDINAKYKQYLPNLLDESSSLEDITTAQNAANAAFVERINLLAAEEKFVDVQKRLLRAKTEELELAKKFTEAQEANFQTDDIEGGLSSTAGVLQAQDAIEANKKLQEELRDEFEETRQAAIELGSELSKLSAPETTADTETETETEDGAGGGSGIVNDVVGDIDAAENTLRESLARLKAVEKQFIEERKLDKLSEEERALKELEAKYQKEIDKAIELEKSKDKQIAATATEQRLALERLQEEALEELRQEQFQTRLERENERLAQKEADDLVAYFERLERQKEVEALVQEELKEEILTQREEELAAIDAHFRQLIALAEHYGVDTSDLNKKWREKQDKVNDKFDKKEEEKRKKKNERRLKAQAQMFTELGNLVSTTLDFVGAEESKHANFQKLITLTQIAFDTASAISSLSAASEANPTNSVTFGAAGAAQFIAGFARILANVAKAKQLLTKEIPQKKEGRWFNVKGEDDKRTYHAQYIGSPKSGMLPSHPVVLASEVGPEYFVSHKDLANPRILNHVRAIENLKGIPQYVEGGATNPLPETTPNNNTQLLEELVNRNTEVLLQLSIQLETLHARLDDETVLGIQNRIREINEAAGITVA